MAKKPSYVAQPELPHLLEERFRVTVAVMSGVITISEGARRLSLSRVQFQTLYHRAIHGLIDGLSPRLPGRPAKSEHEQRLTVENEKLRRDNERLRQQSESIERMLSVASELVRGQARLTSPRRTRTKKKTTRTEGNNDEDPRPERVRALRSLHLRRELVAAVAGVSPSTVGRWSRRPTTPATVTTSPGRPDASTNEPAEQSARQLVRELRGLIGAEALSRAVPGVSRRQAARIKQAMLTAMENERKASVARITVTRAGVIRGFDQLWVPTSVGQRPVLVSADACVPYRTSLVVAERYDSASVARAVDDDFRQNGAPLVWRADRASCHRTDDVDEVLGAWGVLRLHGPPHLARFYGQLERQNREHRGWLASCPVSSPDDLINTCERMRRALNDRWPRRSLGWMTAAEKWATRVIPCEDRTQLRAGVAERVARLRREQHLRDTADELLVQRLAVEHVLKKQGYLRSEFGRWC
jgi:hypothetical protein